MSRLHGTDNGSSHRAALPQRTRRPMRPSGGRRPDASEYRRPPEVPGTDGAHRLTPHRLRGGSAETSPEPPSEEWREWGRISSGGFGSGGGHGDQEKRGHWPRLPPGLPPRLALVSSQEAAGAGARFT
nr:DUF6479 family protein [Streptomyces sp. CC208A]